jgi:asparagine synthase (glutamine-hydrolysing)
MRRVIAGVLGGDPGDVGRVLGALEDPAAATLADGPLLSAWCPAGGHYDDGLICVLDGELTNAAELLAELQMPVSASPEAIVAAAFRAWGEGFATRLRGDLVALLWDREARRGVISRDHLGGSPLFVCAHGRELLFASEIPILLALLPARPPVDEVFLAHWLSLRDAPGRTPYAGLTPLGAGHLLALEGEHWHERTFWAPRYQPALELAPEEAAARMRDALGSAVGRVAGKRPGVLLSGGLDSSTVAALAGPATRGYALTFPTLPAVDESRWVQEIAGSLALAGRRMQLRGGSMLAGALSAPLEWEVPLRPQNLPLFAALVIQAAQDGVQTLLDGEGGDLLFAAARELMADRLRAGRPWEAVRLARRLPGAGQHPPWRPTARLVLDHGLRAALPAGAQAALTRLSLPSWLSPRARTLVREGYDPGGWARAIGPRWWTRRVSALSYALEGIAVRDWARRRAAAAGLIGRSPFFDVDLVELVLALAPELAYHPDRDRPLVREAMAGLLPDRVRLRSGKAYFDDLFVQSLARDDLAAVRRLLGAHDAEVGAWVDGARMREEMVNRVPADHPGGAYAWTAVAWRLVTAECWLRHQGDPEFCLRELTSSELRSPAFELERLF